VTRELPSIDTALFREVLGQYPTGVVVVTATDNAGDAIGMTVGSFTSVSLDPPLVAFLPSKTSSSWRALRESGDSFCINVLGASQEDVCRAVTMNSTASRCMSRLPVTRSSTEPWCGSTASPSMCTRVAITTS